MKSSNIDLYRILGVHAGADTMAIRHAYRSRARRYHPDAGGDERRMMALNMAWTILRDPGRRAAYDLEQRRATLSESTRSGQHEPPTPVGRAFGSVLDFGRYAGWSFGQLAVHDPDYLLWLERTPIGRPMRKEIMATLDMVRVDAPPGLRPQSRRRRSRA